VRGKANGRTGEREAEIAHLDADGGLDPLTPTGVRYLAAHVAELGDARVR
jgi:hypothetical protein